MITGLGSAYIPRLSDCMQGFQELQLFAYEWLVHCIGSLIAIACSPVTTVGITLLPDNSLSQRCSRATTMLKCDYTEVHNHEFMTCFNDVASFICL